MSEIKVNKISPATSTDITLGDSGDTFTVPSGATIVNSGTATGFGGGKVNQIVQGELLVGYRTSTSDTWVDPGLSATITPSAADSKVFVNISNGMVGGENTADSVGARIHRSISGGASGEIGMPTQGSYHAYGVRGWSLGEDFDHTSSSSGGSLIISYLDSPATTSATTYKLQMINANPNSMVLNGVHVTTTTASFPITSSFIQLWEILA